MQSFPLQVRRQVVLRLVLICCSLIMSGWPAPQVRGASVAASIPPRTGNWQLYISPSGSFSLEYPATGRIAPASLNRAANSQTTEILFDECSQPGADLGRCAFASMTIREATGSEAALQHSRETALLQSSGFITSPITVDQIAGVQYRSPTVANYPTRKLVYMQAGSTYVRIALQVIAATPSEDYSTLFDQSIATFDLVPQTRRVYLPFMISAPGHQQYLPLIQMSEPPALARPTVITIPARDSKLQPAATWEYKPANVAQYLETYALWKSNDDGHYDRLRNGTEVDGARFIARAIMAGGIPLMTATSDQNITDLRNTIINQKYGEVVDDDRLLRTGDLILTKAGDCYGWGGVVVSPRIGANEPTVATHSIEQFDMPYHTALAFNSCGSTPPTATDDYQFIRMHGVTLVSSGMHPQQDFYNHFNKEGSAERAWAAEDHVEPISYTIELTETKNLLGSRSYKLPVSLITTTVGLTLPYQIRGKEIEIAKPVQHVFFDKVYRHLFDTLYSQLEDAVEAGQCMGRSATVGAFHGEYANINQYDPQANYVSEARETDKLLEFIDLYQGRQIGSPVQDWLNTQGVQTPLDLVYLIQQRMAIPDGPGSWAKDPLLIGIVATTECEGVQLGHAMLPWKVVEYSAKEYRIYIYDPNVPKDAVDDQNVPADQKYISVSRESNTWQYSFSNAQTWLGNMLSYVPLSKLRERPTYADTDGSLLAFGVRVKWTPSWGNDGRVGDCVDAASVITVTGELSETHVFTQVVPYGGAAVRFPNVLRSPAGSWEDKPLDFFFTNQVPADQVVDGSVPAPLAENVVLSSKGLLGYFGEVLTTATPNPIQGEAASDVAKSVTNHMQVQPDLQRFSLSTSQPAQVVSPYGIRHDKEQRQDIFFAFSDVQLLANELITITSRYNVVEFENQGAEKTVKLGLASIGEAGLSQYQETITIPANSHIAVTAWNWNDLDNTTISIYTDHDNDGTFEDEATLQEVPPTSMQIAPPSYTTDAGVTYFVPGESRLALPTAPATCCLATTMYRLDATPWISYTVPVLLNTTPTTHTLEFFSYDTVSNTEKINLRTLVGYTQRPVTTAVVTGTRSAEGVYTAAVTVMLTATSYLSDVVRVAPHTTYYRLNDGERQVYNGPFTVQRNGGTRIDFWTVDAAGYSEQRQQINVAVDSTIRSVVPLDQSQTQLATSYAAVFDALEQGQILDRLQAPFTFANQTFAPGGLVVPGGIDGPFTHTDILSPALLISPTLGVYGPRVGVLDSSVSRETGHFRTILRGVFGLERVQFITPTQVLTEVLAEFDVLLVPAIGPGDSISLTNQLGLGGQTALRWFGQQPGKTLYLQGQSMQLAPWLDPALRASVALTEEVSIGSGIATISPTLLSDPLLANLITTSLTVIQDPLLTPGAGLQTIASFVNTNHPGSPAILAGPWGQGRLILVAGHPTFERLSQEYVLLANTLLTARLLPLRLDSMLTQQLYPEIAVDALPRQLGATARITRTLTHDNAQPVSSIIVTDTLDPAFALTNPSLPPSEIKLLPITIGSLSYTITQVSWVLPMSERRTSIGYSVRVIHPELLLASHQVATATVSYAVPPLPTRYMLPAQAVTAQMVQAARLEATLSSDHDNGYPMMPSGIKADHVVTMKNTEGSAAINRRVRLIVPLLTPAFNFANGEPALTAERTLPLFANTISFLPNTVRYPLPEGISDPRRVLDVNAWDGTTVYTVTVPIRLLELTSDPGPLCVPIRGLQFGRTRALDGLVRLVPDGDRTHVVLPALPLTWEAGSLPGQDFENPAERLVVQTREVFDRKVVLQGDPVASPTSLMLMSEAVAFLTQLGGSRTPYLLRQAWQLPKFVTPELGAVHYQDLWQRQQKTELPLAFSTLLFPAGYGPSEPYLWSSFSYELRADRDRDGTYETPTPEFNLADEQVLMDGTITISATDSTNRGVQALLPLFKGLGWRLAPAGVNWEQSISKVEGEYELPSVTSDGIYDYLLLKITLQEGRARIKVRAKLWANPNTPEGPLKLTDGLITSYLQPFGSDTRLEFYRAPAVMPWGLTSGLLLTSTLSTNRATVFKDTVYHVNTVSDPHEPRELTLPNQHALLASDQFLKTTSVATSMATVFVGGRMADRSYRAFIGLQDRTVIRYYVLNQGTQPWTNVQVKPGAVPAGLSITPLTDGSTAAATDIPDLDRHTIVPGQQGVYYFAVDTASTLPAAMRGTVQSVSFTIEGDGVLPSDQLPAAQIGIYDAQDRVFTSYGATPALTLTAHFNSIARPIETRYATPAQYAAFAQALELNLAQADALFATLPKVTTTAVLQPDHTFDLTVPLTSLFAPFPANPPLSNTLHVIYKTQLAAVVPGSYTVIYTPTLSFRDFAQIPRAVRGPHARVEIEGKSLSIQRLRDEGIQQDDGRITREFRFNHHAEVTATLRLRNDTANIVFQQPIITLTVPTEVTPTTTITLPQITVVGKQIIWKPGNLSPGSAGGAEVTLTFRVWTPGDNDDPERLLDLINTMEIQLDQVIGTSKERLELELAYPLGAPYLVMPDNPLRLR